mmetsp:Transcript_4507/g.10164  ORF Transcript_4507/g.10164 Transcript_4507/m.10164 type:complete len:149 (+) Transcript_4507:160-606(+)
MEQVGGMDFTTEDTPLPQAGLTIETRCVGTFALAKGLKIYQGEPLQIVPDAGYAPDPSRLNVYDGAGRLFGHVANAYSGHTAQDARVLANLLHNSEGRILTLSGVVSAQESSHRREGFAIHVHVHCAAADVAWMWEQVQEVGLSLVTG